MSALDTIVALGDFEFAQAEVPGSIPFGGTQRTAVHQLVGGKRVIDAMGRSDRDLTWSGWFLGANALNRAQYLDGLRVAGKALTLTWSQFSYQVLIVDYVANFERFYKIPYTVTCQVIADNTKPITTAIKIPVDNQMVDDLSDANALSSQINDPGLSPLMASLTTAVNAVGSFANATASVIGSVLSPLAAVKTQIAVLRAPLDVTLGTAAGFGGIAPGISSFDSLTAFSGQIAANQQYTSLLQLNSLCGRMSNNMLAINESAHILSVAGGNLFSVAANEYGDAMAWTGIAKANGLTDPFIQGIQNLKIPPQADNQDGVLGA